jgi:hypothetical protein
VENNLQTGDDVAREVIQFQLNNYFETPIDLTDHLYHPQIPTYGFLLRSAVVKVFPNFQARGWEEY